MFIFPLLTPFIDWLDGLYIMGTSISILDITSSTLLFTAAIAVLLPFFGNSDDDD